MISGVGIDIEPISSFKEGKLNKNFLNLIYTKKEVQYCKSKKDSYMSFAGKFCAKEAVIKAIDKNIPMKDIEIINNNEGKPLVFIKGKKQKNIFCSISHSNDYAIAQAIIEMKNEKK